MGLSSELSHEAKSFSHYYNSHRIFQSEVLRLYFLALEPWIVQCVLLPSCSSWFICMQMWDCQVRHLPSHLVFQLLSCCESSPSQLLVSAPSTGLNEYFFFNSLVVGLPCSLIFGSSGYFLFLNLLSFFWLCEEAKYMIIVNFEYIVNMR